MVHRALIRYFCPDLSTEEIEKYWLLSLMFVLIVGAYWLLRLLKNTIFLKVAFPVCFGWDPQQGCLFQPYVKTYSSIVVFLLLLAYSKLIDLVKPHQLFYLFSALYAALFFLFAIFLGVRDIYGPEFLGKSTLAGLGWLSYVVIESFGSLMIAYFWSFCNSIADPDSAEQGFPFIVAMAQVSASLGSSLLFFSGSGASLWPLMLIASLVVFCIIPLVRHFMKRMKHDALVTALVHKEPEKNEGFMWGAFEGIYMLATRSYLFGILLISVIYDAVSVILDYQMNAYASSSSLFSSEIAFAKFQSLYGLGVSCMSFIIALFVTGSFLVRFGTRIGLLFYPALFALSLTALIGCFYGGVEASVLLWVLFGVMILIKGVGYSLNNPVVEMMFITTSKKANYKSNAWIDTFASRFAKAGGSSLTRVLQHSTAGLMLYGSLAGLGLVGIWLIAALYVGSRNSQLRQHNQIIT